MEIVYKEWYENGNIKCDGNKEWYEGGEIKREGDKEWYEGGEIKREGDKEWYENGNIKCDGNKEWYESGKIKREGETLLNNEKEWYESGKIKRDGEKEWYENGQVKSELVVGNKEWFLDNVDLFFPKKQKTKIDSLSKRLVSSGFKDFHSYKFKYYDSGEIKSITVYFVIRKNCRYNPGDNFKNVVVFYKSGNIKLLIDEHYKNEWWENGLVKSKKECYYQEGYIDVKYCETFYESGVECKKEIDGVLFEYYESGLVKTKKYNESIPEVTLREWFESGVLKKECKKIPPLNLCDNKEWYECGSIKGTEKETLFGEEKSSRLIKVERNSFYKSGKRKFLEVTGRLEQFGGDHELIKEEFDL